MITTVYDDLMTRSEHAPVLGEWKSLEIASEAYAIGKTGKQGRAGWQGRMESCSHVVYTPCFVASW